MTNRVVAKSPAEAASDFGERGRPLSLPEVNAIRSDFPTLSVEVNGRTINYLDSAATALKPWAVLDAEREFQIGHIVELSIVAPTALPPKRPSSLKTLER